MGSIFVPYPHWNDSNIPNSFTLSKAATQVSATNSVMVMMMTVQVYYLSQHIPFTPKQILFPIIPFPWKNETATQNDGRVEWLYFETLGKA